jgi:hypothetical protein
MATSKQVHEAQVRWAYLLRGMLARIDHKRIQRDRARRLSEELADSMRALAVASRTTMEFVTRFADRFHITLGDVTVTNAEGGDRTLRCVHAAVPMTLAGELPGKEWEGKKLATWAMTARHIDFEALRVAVFDGPAFFVTFAQAKPSEHDLDYFRPAHETQGRPWEGVLPGEDMQSPRQHRTWIQIVSPFAHGHDEKAGNVVLFRRQRQVDPFTGEQTMVPVFTGNAMKGIWRDMLFGRMMRLLNVDPTTLPPSRAQELFAGGTIAQGADGASNNLAARRKARAVVPGVELLGGCIEQQILSGALRVHDCTLLCRENAWKLYRLLKPKDPVGALLTYEEFRSSLRPADDLTSLRLGVRHAHRDLPGSENDVQMLWNTEHLLPGSRLFHSLQLLPLVQMGTLAKSCMADLLSEVSDVGMLGAQTSRGYGQVSTLGYQPAEGAEPLPSPDEYQNYLTSHRAEVVEWLMSEPAKKQKGKRGPQVEAEEAP